MEQSRISVWLEKSKALGLIARHDAPREADGVAREFSRRRTSYLRISPARLRFRRSANEIDWFHRAEKKCFSPDWRNFVFA